MPADSDLFTALQMFQKGVKDLSLQRTLAEANDQVNQIKATEASEQDKRSQLQNLSNALVRSLGAQGVSPTEVAQQADSVYHTFRSPAEAAIQGTLMGKPDLVDAAKQADIAAQAGNMEQLKLQGSIQEKLQAQKLAVLMATKGAGKPLNSNEIDKLQKYDEVQLAGKSLLDQVVANPGLIGPLKSRILGRELVDSDFAAFQSQAGQFFDKYRIAVTGAGASPGELRALQKNVPGMTDTPTNFRKKMTAMLSIGNRVRSRYLDNLGKAGRSVSGFTTPSQAPGDASGTGDQGGGDDLAQFIIGE